jgi:hypothetical protein
MAAIDPQAFSERKDGFERRTNVMDQIIQTTASGVGNSVGWLAAHGVLFAVFTIIWLAFGVGLVWSQGSLDQAWQTIRSLPLILQGLVWLLFLPVTVGLWVWETTWPLVVRLAIVVGVAGWNLLVFFPSKA